MDKGKLEQKYSELLRDTHFDKLSLFLKQPNIFSALRITHYEIRHSNFLAWLLDPNESHGLGDLFIVRFLRDIFLDGRATEMSLIDIPDLRFANAIVHREWNNIDILIEFESLYIVIENKIEAGEHGEQLKKYKENVEQAFPDKKKVFVFLSPLGIEASESDAYINYTYERVIEILENITDLYKDSMNASTALYIKDYVANLKINVMENSLANELARKIYLNHKELLDFIFDNKPDHATEFRKYFEQKVIESQWVLGSAHKGYVRFLTAPLDEIIPKGNGAYGWPNKESFLFVIDYLWTKNKLHFYCTLPPGDEETTAIIKPLLLGLEGAKEPSGKKWRTFFPVKENFNLEKLVFQDEEVIEDSINTFWQKIIPIVNKIEGAILTKREELLAIKNKSRV